MEKNENRLKKIGERTENEYILEIKDRIEEMVVYFHYLSMVRNREITNQGDTNIYG